MNFYKRHLGDIAKACSHLSQGQQGAYDLLLDWLYGNEKPLPASLDACYRIGRAATKTERENVAIVLGEFFLLTAEGYTQKRASIEIANASERTAHNREVGKLGGRPKKNKTQTEPGNNPEGFFQEPENNPSQTPDSRQEQKPTPPASQQAPDTTRTHATAAGLACRLMRDAGCVQTNPSNPELLAALAEGVTPETLADTAREAVEGQARKPFPWAIAAARGRHAAGAKPLTAGARTDDRHDRQPSGQPRSAIARVEANIARGNERQPDRPAIEGSAVRLAG